MPGLSGDEVLTQLRDRDLRTRIIMVTAVDPDLGVLDMPFDDYLSKPVERADLHAAVDQQCQVLAYELLGEYFQRAATRNVAATELAGGGSESRLDDIETELSGLERRIRGLLPQAAELLDGFTEIDRRGY
jgi:DNA-binding response OmpR family regulator